MLWNQISITRDGSATSLNIHTSCIHYSFCCGALSSLFFTISAIMLIAKNPRKTCFKSFLQQFTLYSMRQQQLHFKVRGSSKIFQWTNELQQIQSRFCKFGFSIVEKVLFVANIKFCTRDFNLLSFQNGLTLKFVTAFNNHSEKEKDKSSAYGKSSLVWQFHMTMALLIRILAFWRFHSALRFHPPRLFKNHKIRNGSRKRMNLFNSELNSIKWIFIKFFFNLNLFFRIWIKQIRETFEIQKAALNIIDETENMLKIWSKLFRSKLIQIKDLSWSCFLKKSGFASTL